MVKKERDRIKRHLIATLCCVTSTQNSSPRTKESLSHFVARYRVHGTLHSWPRKHSTALFRCVIRVRHIPKLVLQMISGFGFCSGYFEYICKKEDRLFEMSSL
jgi:hypothetical protein